MKHYVSVFAQVFFCIFLSIWTIFSYLNAQDSQDDQEELRPKIIYLKATAFPQNETIYTGQEIKVSYEVSLFAGAHFIGASFEKIDTDKIELKNKNAQWKNVEQDKFQITYVFKVKQEYAVIPSLHAEALNIDGAYEESASVGEIAISALNLSTNPRYIGVLGTDFKILHYKSKTYDDSNNIVIFEFEIRSQNVRDMKLQNVKNQGFEEIKYNDDKARAIYYAVLPKVARELSFDYFDLELSRFESVQIPVIVSADSLNMQSDLRPKTTSTLFKFVFLGLGVVFFCGLFLWKKSKLALIIAAVLVGTIIYNFTLNSSEAVLKSGAHLSILPMNQSTIVRIIESDIPVEIMDSRQVIIDGNLVMFYKVLIGDSQIGWVRSEYVSKD